MTPTTIALIIGLLEEAIKVSPAIAAELKTIFAKPDPTPQDWLNLKSKVLGQSFESLAPDAVLPVEKDTPQAPV
jgi:plasmid maintenance system antidote protein VapI